MTKKEFFLPNGAKFCVIGDPVAHSRSPQMQNAAFVAAGMGRPYCKVRVTPDELPDFVDFARENLRGFNLTVPHKQAVIPLLDAVDQAAALAGSVNTVRVESGGFTRGFSTDGYGLECVVKEKFHLPLAGTRFLMLGAGGAARAVAFHLVLNQVARLTITNRTFERARQLVEELRKLPSTTELRLLKWGDRDALAMEIRSADALLQMTKLGLGIDDAPPFDLSLLNSAKCAVFDAVYRFTPLLRHAAQLGLPHADGKLMLIRQGEKSFEIWNGTPPAPGAMERGFELADSE